MRKRRGRLARLVTIFLALVVALVLTGMGYGLWSDTISIIGNVEIGYIEVQLSDCTSSVNMTCKVDPPGSWKLNVLVENAGVGPSYYCYFIITNTGSIPVKISYDIDSDDNGAPDYVSVYITDDELNDLEGVQIEQDGVTGNTVNGIVEVILSQGASPNFDFDVTFDFVQWNLYVPPP